MRGSRSLPVIAGLLGGLLALSVSGCGDMRPASTSDSGGTAQCPCNGCHGDATSPAPPRGLGGTTSTTDVGVGAHRSHLNGGSIRGPVQCTECHIVPATIDAPGHLGAPPADVTFGPLAQSKGAAPTWSNPQATCSNVYCHGSTLAGGSLTAPVWTRVDGTQAACGTCHGAPPPVSSGHPAVTGGLTACATCHPGTVKPDGTIDVAGGLHIDGKVDVSGAHPPGWMTPGSGSFHGDAAKAGLGTCQACHGANLDGQGGTATTSCATCHGANWKTNCTMCHGDKPAGPSGRSSPPRDIRGNTATTEVTVGAHAAHFGASSIAPAFDCTACHLVPADALSPGHVDAGPAEITWGSLATSGGAQPAWNRSSATCSNVYCHGSTLTGAGGSNTNPVWTQVGSGQAACGSCHAVPPPAPHPQRPDLACSSCHAGYTATAVNLATHLNGVVDVAALTCTTCHGDASQVATPAAPLLAAPPAGTRGETDTATRAVGAHQRHLATGATSNAIACSECHA